MGSRASTKKRKALADHLKLSIDVLEEKVSFLLAIHLRVSGRGAFWLIIHSIEVLLGERRETIRRRSRRFIPLKLDFFNLEEDFSSPPPLDIPFTPTFCQSLLRWIPSIQSFLSFCFPLFVFPNSLYPKP